MLLDFRTLDRKETETDLCIIGAGAAGITLARDLAGTDIRVCLLESGGLDYEPQIQALYEGQDSGFQEGSTLVTTRLRYLGGSTNAWVGHCAPYGALDFEPRSWVPYSGWPIRRQGLDPWYQAAQQLFEIGPYQYDMGQIPGGERSVPPFDPDRVLARVWQMSPPTRFGSRYRHDLEQAPNIQVWLYANVTGLEATSDASRVKVANIRTLDGHTGRVRAKYFVLACGGIENARILLLSNRQEAAGLGNRHDLVGRFYMDHTRVERSAIALVRDDREFDALIDEFNVGGIRYRPILCPGAEAQRKQETLNWCAQVTRGHYPVEGGYLAARAIRDALRAGRWPEDFAGKVWAVISDLDSVASDVYQRFKPRPLNFLGRSENAPDPDSRIVLTSERDALGQNKVQRNWRIGSQEKHTLRQAMRLLGEEFGRLGLGRVQLPQWLVQENDDWPDDNYGAGVHHLGMTRMAADPRQGVVDANCRVHTMENLYIAGGSVFPTSGYTHPTLTVGAMSLRLSDWLKRLFRG